MIYHRGRWANSNATTDGSKSLIIWKSEDLVNWSVPWLTRVIPDNVGMAWAPEAIWDAKNHNYFVYWASNLLNEQKNTMILSSHTTDCKQFSKYLNEIIKILLIRQLFGMVKNMFELHEMARLQLKKL